MTFGKAIASGFRNYATSGGRAARSEYWHWTLFTVLVSIVTMAIDYLAFRAREIGPVEGVASLALLVPSVAVSIRRLHDIDRTGWWLLIVFTVVGIILLIVWACLKGTTGPNQYGPDPLAR
jgi:uncharacterized membrane protein YhaH (DUF805 family)